MDNISIREDGHDWVFKIPTITSTDQTTEVTRDSHRDMQRVHAHTVDLYELYFEIVSHASLLDHAALIEKQKPFISEKFSNVTFSEVETCQFKGLPSTAFTFTSDEKTRRFMFIDSQNRSYRVILNPLSPLNFDVLESLNF